MNSIRSAQKQDLVQIEKLFKAVRDSVNPSIFNWPDDLIQQEMQQSSFYISETYEKNIEAFISYRESADGVEIMALGTQPKVCRRGLMKELLTEFVQKYSKEERSIYLEVHADNQKALSLYHQIGFKTQRVRKAYYQDGADAVVMHFAC